MEEFWQCYNHIPKPGKAFFDGESKASIGPSNKVSLREICLLRWAATRSALLINRRQCVSTPFQVIDELSIFKKGIKPEWEDKANRDGGCFFIRKALDPDQVDIYWQNTVLALIGEAIDDGDNIAGARIVDKGGKQNFAFYRFELWLKTADSSVVQKIKERFHKVIQDGAPNFKKAHPQFEWKKHK